MKRRESSGLLQPELRLGVPGPAHASATSRGGDAGNGIDGPVGFKQTLGHLLGSARSGPIAFAGSHDRPLHEDVP